MPPLSAKTFAGHEIAFDNTEAHARPDGQIVTIRTRAGTLQAYWDTMQNPYMHHQTWVEPVTYARFLYRLQDWITVDENPTRCVLRSTKLHLLQQIAKEIHDERGSIPGLTPAVKINTAKLRTLIKAAQRPAPRLPTDRPDMDL